MCPHGKVEGVGCRECAHARHRVNQINKAFENSKYELIPGRKEKVQGGGKYQPKKMNKKEINTNKIMSL